MKIRLPRRAAVVLAVLVLALAFAALRIWDAVSGDNRRAAARRQAIVLSAEPPAAGAGTVRAATGMAQGSGSVASGSGQEAGIAR